MRKVTAHSASNSRTISFETNATTWGELKADLQTNGFTIDSKVSVTEGYSKIVFVREDTILPTNTPYKTGTTNDLAIFINPSKNISSGVINRKETYDYIKTLPENVRKKYFPTYSSMSNVDLEKSLIKYKTLNTKNTPESSSFITKRVIKLDPAVFSTALNDIYTALILLYNQEAISSKEFTNAQEGVVYLTGIFNVKPDVIVDKTPKEDPAVSLMKNLANEIGVNF